MATATERYNRATSYAHHAIASVSRSMWSVGVFDYYGNQEKTKTARQDLERIEARWWRASVESERNLIARDAELLADRIKENLPGAPLDWQRTNLAAGEIEKTQPPTTFASDLNDRANEVWAWASGAAERTTHGVTQIGAFVLIGGGLLLGSQVVSLLRGKQANRLLVSLERTANERGGGK